MRELIGHALRLYAVAWEYIEHRGVCHKHHKHSDNNGKGRNDDCSKSEWRDVNLPIEVLAIAVTHNYLSFLGEVVPKSVIHRF